MYFLSNEGQMHGRKYLIHTGSTGSFGWLQVSVSSVTSKRSLFSATAISIASKFCK